jgi:hypothetical protein
MRLPAPAVLGFLALGIVSMSQPAAASSHGPAYYEALMRYCYSGALSDRLGRDPDSRSVIGVGSKRAALSDLREAMQRGERAVTALCAAGYYRAVGAGYLRVVRR